MNNYLLLINFICEFVFIPQTNKLNNYLILFNSICEFVCGFCGHANKTYRPVYRVAAQPNKQFGEKLAEEGKEFSFVIMLEDPV